MTSLFEESKATKGECQESGFVSVHGNRVKTQGVPVRIYQELKVLVCCIQQDVMHDGLALWISFHQDYKKLVGTWLPREIRLFDT